MQKLRIKDSPRLWKESTVFYNAMDFDKMVSIYKDRFQDASDFHFYLTGNIQREEARELVAKYLGAIPSTFRKEKAVHHDLRIKGSMTGNDPGKYPGQQVHDDHRILKHVEIEAG